MPAVGDAVAEGYDGGGLGFGCGWGRFDFDALDEIPVVAGGGVLEGEWRMTWSKVAM